MLQRPITIKGISVEAKASLRELVKKAIQHFTPEVTEEELIEYVAKRAYERFSDESFVAEAALQACIDQ
eukprot:4465729-Lingulodinium_polyedra.AAC.1